MNTDLNIDANVAPSQNLKRPRQLEAQNSLVQSVIDPCMQSPENVEVREPVFKKAKVEKFSLINPTLIFQAKTLQAAIQEWKWQLAKSQVIQYCEANCQEKYHPQEFINSLMLILGWTMMNGDHDFVNQIHAYNAKATYLAFTCQQAYECTHKYYQSYPFEKQNAFINYVRLVELQHALLNMNHQPEHEEIAAHLILYGIFPSKNDAWFCGMDNYFKVVTKILNNGISNIAQEEMLRFAEGEYRKLASDKKNETLEYAIAHQKWDYLLLFFTHLPVEMPKLRIHTRCVSERLEDFLFNEGDPNPKLLSYSDSTFARFINQVVDNSISSGNFRLGALCYLLWGYKTLGGVLDGRFYRKNKTLINQITETAVNFQLGSNAKERLENHFKTDLRNFSFDDYLTRIMEGTSFDTPLKCIQRLMTALPLIDQEINFVSKVTSIDVSDPFIIYGLATNELWDEVRKFYKNFPQAEIDSPQWSLSLLELAAMDKQWEFAKKLLNDGRPIRFDKVSWEDFFEIDGNTLITVSDKCKTPLEFAIMHDTCQSKAVAFHLILRGAKPLLENFNFSNLDWNSDSNNRPRLSAEIYCSSLIDYQLVKDKVASETAVMTQQLYESFENVLTAIFGNHRHNPFALFPTEIKFRLALEGLRARIPALASIPQPQILEKCELYLKYKETKYRAALLLLASQALTACLNTHSQWKEQLAHKSDKLELLETQIAYYLRKFLQGVAIAPEQQTRFIQHFAASNPAGKLNLNVIKTKCQAAVEFAMQNNYRSLQMTL